MASLTRREEVEEAPSMRIACNVVTRSDRFFSETLASPPARVPERGGGSTWRSEEAEQSHARRRRERVERKRRFKLAFARSLGPFIGPGSSVGPTTVLGNETGLLSVWSRMRTRGIHRV